ncbi:MAG: PAS domain-containing protein [Leptospiraceae bacterium]|nr:PAS domain-containing protein [Leptospiraceae bacterium]
MSRASLQIASLGVYHKSKVEHLPANIVDKYFKRENHLYSINPEIRKLIVFAPHNLLSDPPFTRIDLLTCRNVLIYFKPQAQRKVLSLFHFALNLKGYLFLGKSETPGSLKGMFQSIHSGSKIFQKIRNSRFTTNFSLSNHSNKVQDTGFRSRKTITIDPERIRVYESVMNLVIPSGFLTTEEGGILHVFGNAQKYLDLSGRTDMVLQHKIIEDLKIPILSILQKGKTQKERSIVFNNIRAKVNKESLSLKLSLNWLNDRITKSPYFLIQIEDIKISEPVQINKPDEYNTGANLSERIEYLEIELETNKENLQATVEELETTNEELQASNEELQASNEELQSTNEELHSVNEELYSVNAEYEKKIEELTQLTSDMDNLLKSTKIGTIFLDNNLCIRWFSPDISATIQLLPQDIGRPISHIARNFDGGEDLLEILYKVIETREIVEKEVTNQEGSHFLQRVLPYVNLKNEIDGAILSYVNITRLKKTQKMLEEHQKNLEKLVIEKTTEIVKEKKLLQALIDATPYPISLKDKNGKFLRVNPAYEEFANKKADDILGKTVFELFTPEEAERLSENDNEVAQEETTNTVVEKISNKTYQTQRILLEYEKNKEGILCIRKDITEIAKSEAELKEAKERLEMIMDAGKLFPWEYDIKNNKVTLDNRLLKALGYHEFQEPNVLFDVEKFKNYVHETDFGKGLKAIEASYYSSNTSFNFESRFIDKHDLYTWYLIAGEIVEKDEKGKPTKAVGIHQNIQARKDMELELVSERKKAEKANNAKSAFLANMSHEIRTPMNAIIGYSEILSGFLQDSSQKKYVDSIKSSSKLLLSLINDILDLSKIEAGNLEIKREPVNLLSLLEEISSLFLPLVKNKELNLIKNFPDEILYYFMLDELRVRQILLNLMGNAIKFTKNGYISLQVELNNIQGNQADIVLKVKDTGIGISDADVPKIFNAFQQSEDTKTAKDYGGTGLGLAITKKLIEMMNGTIRVESEINKGSEFIVEWKYVEIFEKKNQNISFTIEKPENIVFEKSKILVVDDVLDNRDIIRYLLRGYEIEVTDAQNGNEGIKKAKEELPDLILMDLRMPSMDGFEAAGKIREDEVTKNIPMIAYTASVFNIDSENMKWMFDNILFKPIQKVDLVNLIKKYLKYSISDVDELHTKIHIDKEMMLPLLKKMEADLFPLYEAFKSTPSLRKARDFANMYNEISSGINLEIIKKYADELEDAIRSFDVESINVLIKDIQNLYKTLKKLTEWKG